MTPDDVQKRFIEEINLRAYDDKYIDKNEEREILQIAIHHGMIVEDARRALQEVCARQGYIVESAILEKIKSRLVALHQNGGQIDQPTFTALVREVQTQVGEKRTERDVKKLVVIVMEDNALNKVKLRWPRNWYAAIKKEIGMR
jgi:hypothetical protein